MCFYVLFHPKRHISLHFKHVCRMAALPVSCAATMKLMVCPAVQTTSSLIKCCETSGDLMDMWYVLPSLPPCPPLFSPPLHLLFSPHPFLPPLPLFPSPSFPLCCSFDATPYSCSLLKVGDCGAISDILNTHQ